MIKIKKIFKLILLIMLTTILSIGIGYQLGVLFNDFIFGKYLANIINFVLVLVVVNDIFSNETKKQKTP